MGIKNKGRGKIAAEERDRERITVIEGR